MDEIQKRLLLEVADLHEVPEGAYNIRANSQSAGRRSTANIEITSKQDVSGLEIRIRPGTKNESVHSRCGDCGGLRHRQLRESGFPA